MISKLVIHYLNKKRKQIEFSVISIEINQDLIENANEVHDEWVGKLKSIDNVIGYLKELK